jgi:hypothetical protein
MAGPIIWRIVKCVTAILKRDCDPICRAGTRGNRSRPDASERSSVADARGDDERLE